MTSPPEPAPAPAPEGDRLDRVESKVDRLADAVERFLGGGHPAPPADDGPADIGEQVRAELAKAREAEEAQRAAETEQQEKAQLRADVAALKERAPTPPVPRRTRMLGWGDR